MLTAMHMSMKKKISYARYRSEFTRLPIQLAAFILSCSLNTALSKVKFFNAPHSLAEGKESKIQHC